MKVLILGKGIANDGVELLLRKDNIEYDYLNPDAVSSIDYKFVVKAPGIPYDNDLILRFLSNNIRVMTDIELAFILRKKFYICITGSNGKTTTSTLITNILSKKHYTVLCGNIGYSVCKAVVEHEEAEIFVVELSSFQLENSIIDPDISVILNISPCHLDHHKTFKNYYESKKNISLNQSDNQIVIYNFEDSYCSKIVNDSLAKKVSFSTESVLTDCYVYHNCIYFKKRKILKLNNCIQSKQFLLKDYMAAISTVMQISKISPKIIKNVINKFEGVKYRLSPIYENIYNDAKSTNPFSTIAALEGLDNVFLICGGYDRYENLGVLNEYLYKIKKVFVYGATAEKVYNYMTLNNVSCYKFDNLFDATKEALSNRSNEVILYSPMFASYDQFSSYIERGELFEKIIKDYKK